jgi:signal transduction histidine kinase
VLKTQKFQRWRRFLFGIRSRFIVLYVVLMACSTGISILAVRQILSLRLEEQSKNILFQDVKEFRQLVQDCANFSCNVSTLFDTFLSRKIPVDGEFMLGFVNGKLYKSSPIALPESLRWDASLIARWAQLTQSEKGEKFTSKHRLRYLAEPVIIGGKNRGVFVVIHSTQRDLQKVNEVTAVMLLVTVIVFIVASAITWGMVGRVLQPLHFLTARSEAFVRQVFEGEYSIAPHSPVAHLPVQGSDEIAELTITFNEMLDRIQAAFTSQRNFINDAGHELRTPITIIRGHLELLGDDPQEQQETIALVMDELDRMNRLVNELLLLAKAERPDFLSLEPVEIGTLIEELFAKVKALEKRHWQLESRALGHVLADRQRLTQAMMNLVQNAVQHTNVNDTITLGASLTNHYIRFWVQDTGEGIPLEDQERIFERFARGARSRRRSGGYGLGLALVRAIAQSHGGKVELQSEPGKGSTFTLILPMEPHLETLGNGESLK